MSRRIAVVGITSLVALLLPAGPAVADPVVVDGGEGRVKTGIQLPASPGRVSEGDTAATVVSVGERAATTHCSSRRLTPLEARAAGLLSPGDGGVDAFPSNGNGYFELHNCAAPSGGRLIRWVPEEEGAVPPSGAVLLTPAMLAQDIHNTLELPEPAVGVSPDGLNDNPALVNLPTWWWVTNGAAMTQRTQLGSVWAEVTAEPVSSAYVAGDGERSECVGLGIAYLPGMRENEPGKCSHTYARANTSEEAQIQVVWQVSWVGSGGTGGTLEPFTLTATQAVPVYERHAIVTSSG